MSRSERPPSVRVAVRQTKHAVINPASAVRLTVVTVIPDGPGPYPLVVLVPGGLSAGETYFGGPGIARRLAGLGYAVAYFDPDGRGDSGGHEDYNGAIHQRGLVAVIATASAQPRVDPQRVVVAGFCFGATMAAGALARQPDLDVGLFIDWEGPADRNDTRAGADLLGWALPAESQTDDWWRDREGLSLIDRVRARYLRVEGRPNHLRTDPTGALALVGRAGGRPEVEGSLRWSRLNGNPPNRVWASTDAPRWLPRLPAETAVMVYLAELVPPRPAS